MGNDINNTSDTDLSSDLKMIADVVKHTAFNIQTVSEQMGLLQTEMKGVKLEQMRQAEQIGTISDRMEMYEQRLNVDRNEANNIRSSIHRRVVDLLGLRYEDGVIVPECREDDVRYRGKFIQRCYVDARKDSYLGTPYYATYRKDYQEVLDYIGRWVPSLGVQGYKDYLDQRAKLRGKS